MRALYRFYEEFALRFAERDRRFEEYAEQSADAWERVLVERHTPG